MSRLQGSGYVLHDGLRRLILLDHGFGFIDKIDVYGDSASRPLQVVWELAEAGDAFYGVGDFKKKGRVGTAFFRSDSHLLSEPEVIEWLPRDETLSAFLRMLRPSVSSLGNHAYALRYDGGGHLFRLSGEPGVLKAFPPGFDQMPRLPASRGVATAALRARSLARQKAAVALFAGQRNLFVLTHQRSPSGNGGLSILWEIDPRADRLVAGRVLPSTAEKLVLAPGPRWWIALEQGPQTDVARQETQSLLWIPTAWIEGTSSPLPDALRSGSDPPASSLELCHDDS